jgi:threonine dehydratase
MADLVKEDVLAVTFADVQAARERVRPYVYRTPVLTSQKIDERVGARVFFKCETFQRVGAFKARGAFSRLTLMTPEERARGVVAFSSGNHAQAVALAARELQARATIVMPKDAPALKVAATRGYGAEVILYDRQGGESREEIARRIVDEQGAALELLEEVPDLDVIVTPCGGGGLLSGCALAAKGINPEIRLWGVEPETGDDVKRSLAAGHPVTIPLPATIADALQTTRPAERTLAIIRALVEGILTASDLEMRRAMALLAARMKIVVEPGGSIAFAALLHGKVPGTAGRKVGIVLSGGNVDPDRFGALISGLDLSEP